MRIKNVVAVAALMCVAGSLSACSLLDNGAGRDADSQITEAGQVDAFSLHIGDCLVSSDLETEFEEVPAVPCTEAHDTEVIYLFDMPDGAFDDDAISAAADDACATAMDDYVGPNWGDLVDGDLSYSYFTPTEDGWAQGDHEVDCVAQTYSGDLSLTSSLKGLGV